MPRHSALFVAVALLMEFGFSSASSAEKRREDNNMPSEKMELAFVTLNSLATPNSGKVEAALRRYLPQEVTLSEIKIDEGMITFQIDGRLVAVAYMPRPIPWPDLEEPCASNWQWPEATKVIKPHRSHAMVFTTGLKGSQLHRCIVFTKAIAAATEFLDSSGVYWGHGDVVLPPDQWRERADKGSEKWPPLLDWVNFRVSREKSGATNVITTGMEYFDCMEIEIIASRKPPKEVFDMALGAAHITLLGEKIPDGDTIGPEGTDLKFKTRHAKSVYDRPKKVLRIDF